MTSKRVWSQRMVLLAMLLVGAGGVGRTQNQSSGLSQNPTAPHDPLAPLSPALPPGIASKQEKARNDERQKRLMSDSEKLLALATQLNDEVRKTDKNILSVDVIKRAEEIEKLARAVKERERG